MGAARSDRPQRVGSGHARRSGTDPRLPERRDPGSRHAGSTVRSTVDRTVDPHQDDVAQEASRIRPGSAGVCPIRPAEVDRCELPPCHGDLQPLRSPGRSRRTARADTPLRRGRRRCGRSGPESPFFWMPDIREGVHSPLFFPAMTKPVVLIAEELVARHRRGARPRFLIRSVRRRRPQPAAFGDGRRRRALGALARPGRRRGDRRRQAAAR